MCVVEAFRGNMHRKKNEKSDFFHTLTVWWSGGRPKVWSITSFAEFRVFLLKNHKRGFCLSVNLVMSFSSTALPVLLIVFLFCGGITIRLQHKIHRKTLSVSPTLCHWEAWLRQTILHLCYRITTVCLFLGS